MRASFFLTGVAGLTLVAATARPAAAFCGFYVAGGGAELFNNATQVVLMRDGTRTVLSMQNNYQGPPADFAMVVPVPVVLKEEHVKTLSKDLFTHLDRLASPRLVEYWEEDPCQEEELHEEESAGMGKSMAMDEGRMGKPDADGVTIEARFVVGEYQIVILSAKEASGLENWLHANKYNVPKGANSYLRPYVESGSKFFVAKVDISKVKYEKGMAMLSPLRFHYDSPELALPVRLGLMNASGAQDLIVHVLARGQRYEVANYPNVFIPTNLDVKDIVRHQFAEFYTALFDRTLGKNPGAVVTEYAWDVSTCDPCPTPALGYHEVEALGADVVGAGAGGDWVVTRLHARYDASSMTDDLVFRAAPPVVGGREHVTDGDQLEEGARTDSYNNFQARYAIRHAWSGEIACKDPVRGRWGGPPGGAHDQAIAATDLAFVARDAVVLEQAVAEDIPELGVIAAVGAAARPTGSPSVPSGRRKRASGGCGCDTGPRPGAPLTLLLIAGAIALARRPKRAKGTR
jgi:MYXO-CTERM domain-containing protein